MNGILKAAVDVNQAFNSLGYPYCIIGGLALQRWGEPRMTVDIDVTVLSGFGKESVVVQQLLQRFPGRMEDVVSFAEQNRIALLKTQDGIGLDVSLGALPFEERLMERASDWTIPEYGAVRTCSAEDLVILKSFAARPQDWIDVASVITRNTATLDRKLILAELTPLAELKEDLGILSQLNALFSA
ncbi:MAG: nucleotidyl transferase AbiEii/AbiGii toxin family protein [Fuerstiella sp.]|nr:nucleotidyl transferase AbiEii/AbiGii toxin family protein [Fuerstiella sp.]